MDNKIINISLLKCRKCNGQHLTIKCGKSKSIQQEPIQYIKNEFKQDKKYKLKISNLPSDISYNELSNLLINWGHINKIIVRNFYESSYAIIEFKYEDEIDYFINALHGTPFDYQILNIEKFIEI